MPRPASLVHVSVLFLASACFSQPPEARIAAVPGDFVLRDFRFASGEVLPEVKMHFRTFGVPKRDERGRTTNAVLVLHGTGGEGSTFLRREFSGTLFGRGQPLDAARYYIIIPDNLGHGRSSKPSDGLRAKFPKYGYLDMITAQHRLLTEGLQVDHLRLVMGTSMGGMHTWLWGQVHPDFMDALLPLACLPEQISGRNRLWRKLISDVIRSDPEWQGGEYQRQPRTLGTAARMLQFMSSNPVLMQRAAPTLQGADRLAERYTADFLRRGDANDLLYAIEASEDYDPAPGLGKITAPLLAINFADDLINPPELGILEKQIQRVRNGRAILVPFSPTTVGHGTHTKATVWIDHLTQFMKETEK